MSRRNTSRVARAAGRALHIMLLLAAACLPAVSLLAADAEARLGIGGVHRTGAWTPLTVRPPEGQGAAVRCWVEDPDGQWVGSPVAATAADQATARWSVRPGRPAGRVRIEWLHDDQSSGAAAAATNGDSDADGLVDVEPAGDTVPSTTPLLLVVGEVPAASAAAGLVAGDEQPAVVVVFDPTSDHLTAPRDLDGFDAAIVCGSQLASLPPEAIATLDGWVRQGGRLIFSAAASALEIAAADSPAATWLPGTSPRLVPLRRFGAAEAYARAGGLTGRLPPTGIDVPRFEGPDGVTGVVEAFEGNTATDLPLVVRRAHGFGTITWVGLDLDAAWCRAWPGSDRLVAALLGGREEQETAAAPAEDVRRVPDLAGQLRVALDSFAADTIPTRPVPFELIAGLGVLYALALYPLDWLVVSRSGRPWIAWLTLPLLAGGFTVAAWGIGGLWGRDAPAEAQVAEVIDFDAGGSLVRGFSWAAVRSPANDQLDLAVAVEPTLPAAAADIAVSWCADAGSGFGGVDAAVAHPSLAAGSYAYGDTLASLERVPIAAAASRLFEVTWTGAAAGPVAESSLVRDPRGLLTGSVSHRLPFALEGCWLIHAGWLYDVGRMEPGATYDTEKGRGPRSLAAALTRRTAKWEADRAERWDVGDIDVGRILQLAGLHAAAGGRAYTSLEAGRLGRLDVSPLLAVDRAILVGRAAAGVRGTNWRLRLGAGQGGDEDAGRLLEARPADSGSLVRIAIPLPASEGEETP